MNQQAFAKNMIYLSNLYGKEIPKSQVEIWYEYFKKISANTLLRAIKKIGSTSEYFPTLAKLLEYCEKVEIEYRLQIVEKMYQEGYFKYSIKGEQSYTEEMSDYQKAIGFTGAGILPVWFEEDMIKYGYVPPEKAETTKQISNDTKLLGRGDANGI